MTARNASVSSQPAAPSDGGVRRRAIAAHIAPYLLWLLPMAAFQAADWFGLSAPRAWSAPTYAVKSLLCAALLLWLKPWRFYAPRGVTVQSSKFKVQSSATQPQREVGTRNWEPRTGNCLALVAGLAVAVLWVFPESPWLFARATGLVEFYNRWLIMTPGEMPSYFSPGSFPLPPEGHVSLAYSPAECGWALTIAKLLGSAFVISAAEEWFFRGFLYRWLRKGDFLTVEPARYDAQAFWTVVLLFGLEHDRWLAGMAAGAVYGWLVLKTGRVGPAIVAHATTNLALGIYVILSRQYGFW